MAYTFVLTDESVNTYGYRVLTAGIDTARFNRNPVMLYCHDHGLLPIGTWENLRNDGNRLVADASFDTDDPFAAQVAAKVEGGVIRCCSIGFTADEVRQGADGVPEVTRSTLLEASICPVGANPGALRLSHGAQPDGMPAVAKGMYLTLTNTFNIMDKNEETLTTSEEEVTTTELSGTESGAGEQQETAASLTPQEELAKLRTSVTDLTAQLEASQRAGQLQEERAGALQAELDEARRELAEMRSRHNEQLLADAMADGCIGAQSRDHWRELFKLAPEATAQALAALPKRTSLAATLQQAATQPTEDWDTLDRAGQLQQLKEQDPDRFYQLFRDKFGKEYNDN